MANISKIKLPDGNTHDIVPKNTICPIYTLYGSLYTCNYTYDELSTMFNNGYNVVPIIRTSTGVFRIVNGTVDITSDIVWNLQCADYDVNEFYNLTIKHNSNNTITRTNHGYVTYQPEIPVKSVTTSDGYTHSSGWGMYVNGTTISTTTYPTIRRYGDIISFNGIFSNNSQVAAGTNPTIGTIASAYRPSEEFRIVIHGSGQNIAIVKFATDGKVVIERYGTTASTAAIAAKSWIPIHATWIK